MPHTTKGRVMPETVTTEAPEVTATTDLEGATPENDELGEKGVAALKSEREARKAAEKEKNEIAARLKVLEDKDKSESERQQEALETARAELEALTTAKTRAEVAADKAIPTSLLAGPASNSEEDIAAFADALIAFKGEQKQTPSSTAISRVNSGAIVHADPATAFAEALHQATGR